MKMFLVVFGLIASTCVLASGMPGEKSWDSVYCDYYRSSSTSGYSLYRTRDGVDLGNAVWTGDDLECGQAANMANRKREGIVCARYHSRSSGNTSYSVYRIEDGADLGNAVISDFRSCQAAVRSARNGIFCSTYYSRSSGRTSWSMYDVRTGQDLGRNVYATVEECQRQY